MIKAEEIKCPKEILTGNKDADKWIRYGWKSAVMRMVEKVEECTDCTKT